MLSCIEFQLFQNAIRWFIDHLKENNSSQQILREWLFQTSNKKQIKYHTRSNLCQNTSAMCLVERELMAAQHFGEEDLNIKSLI